MLRGKPESVRSAAASKSLYAILTTFEHRIKCFVSSTMHGSVHHLPCATVEEAGTDEDAVDEFAIAVVAATKIVP